MKRIIKTDLLGILLLIIIIAAIFFVLFGRSGLTNFTIGQPQLQQGTLDLSDWDSADNQLINLNGAWEFYWCKLLTYDDFRDSDSQPDLWAEVPQVWNSYEINGQNLPGYGYATYRLKVVNAKEGQAFGIRMPTVSTAYNLFINDRLVASNGKVGVDQQHFAPEYRPAAVSFVQPSTSFDIILQAANFSYARGGAWYPITMGSAAKIVAYDKDIGYKDLFLVGAFLMMALYYFCIFFMRKEDKSSLYFALLCLAFMGRTIIYGDYFINSIFPWATYQVTVAVDYICLAWAPVFFAYLTAELFPEQTSRKVNIWFTVYAVFISLLVIISPIHLYTQLVYLMQAIALIMTAYATVCTARAYPQNKIDSAFIIAGTIIVMLGGVQDILYHENVISSGFEGLSTFGFFLFLLLYGIVLAKRLAEAFSNAELLSQKLIKLDKLKDEFLANTSHELRTPLNAMINIADGISRGTEGAVNEKQKAALNMVTISGKRLIKLIGDILDYLKLKNLDLPMNCEAVNLKRAVESVMNVLEWLDKKQTVQMQVDLPDDLPDIYADENRLLQILYNLVGNAVKFTEDGYIMVSAALVGDMVEVCVEDTGIGIPEDRFGIIFESFQQLDGSLTRSEGTGLGLPMCKYMVESHGGTIRVESKVGTGSKFYFTMPLATAAAESASWPYTAVEAEMAAARYGDKLFEDYQYRYESDGPNIILVDDNKTNLISLAGILKMDNYSIAAVTSSEEFYAVFKAAADVSLVILDVMLPGLSGYEICREIRKTFTVSELPVLMLTARTTTQDIVMGMEAGANDYLTKPFDADELLARVKTLVQLKQSVDKARASELAFLQAQIKPHFLFNALNTVVSISLYDTDQARNLIIELGNYLRRSFDFKNLSQLVPLKNELELARAYLEIEKARFGERIKVKYDLTDDLEGNIPILTLQPIVENAVIHGILPKAEGGLIEICIKRDDAAFYFKVADNGIGMEPEKLDPNFNHEFGSGVGLANIEDRLRKLYRSGLQISSIPGVGTEVTWCVPFNRK